MQNDTKSPKVNTNPSSQNFQRVSISTDEQSTLKQENPLLKPILVVGSAPNATLYPCNFAYFANHSALAFHSDQIVETCTSFSILINATRIIPELFPRDPLQREMLSENKKRLEDFAEHTRCPIIVCATKEKFIPNRSALKVPYKLILPEDLQTIYTIAAGYPPPYLSINKLVKYFPHYPKPISKLIGQSISLNIRARKGRPARTPGSLRPSAGLTALAYAINTHGCEQAYHLTGISFDARSKHTIFGDISKVRKPFQTHTLADQVFISCILHRGTNVLVDR